MATVASAARPSPGSRSAGGSAQRIYDHRRQRRDGRLDRRFGPLAGLVRLAAGAPSSTRAWAQGASGERRVAEALARQLGDRAVVLHDRRIPGERASIDHVAIAGSGVWVIDAKAYGGLVERRDVGGLRRRDDRLYVNNRDRTSLLDGLGHQVEVVVDSLARSPITVPVHAALCFVGSEWRLLSLPFRLQGHWVSWPRALARQIDEPGALGPGDVVDVAELLARALPPA